MQCVACSSTITSTIFVQNEAGNSHLQGDQHGFVVNVSGTTGKNACTRAVQQARAFARPSFARMIYEWIIT